MNSLDDSKEADESGCSEEDGTSTAIRNIAADQLLGPRGLVHIELDGEVYTLRLTRNRRLILTK